MRELHAMDLTCNLVELGGCIMPESYFGNIVRLQCLQEGSAVKNTFGEV
jgi:hypothetical protein